MSHKLRLSVFIKLFGRFYFGLHCRLFLLASDLITVDVQFSSAQDVVCRAWEGHMRSAQFLRSFSSFSFVRFTMTLVFSGKIVEPFLFLRLFPLGDRWCSALGFVPAGGVSSSSTLQTFRGASRLSQLTLLWACVHVYVDCCLDRAHRPLT